MRLISTIKLLLLFTLLPFTGLAQQSLEEVKNKIQFEGDTIEGIFKYVVTSVRYDTKFKDAPPEYHSHDEVLADVLTKNSGVCMHYAALFHALCIEYGYKSYIISGYTKYMNQEPAKVPHAWNAVRIKGKWFLFDPTWASGYVVGEKFIPYYDNSWYKRTPEQFIYSHIPFDPAFQLLSTPISHRSIARNEYNPGKYLDFNLLLEQFDVATEEEQLEQSLNRISAAGISNQLIKNKINYLENQLSIIRHNQQVYSYSKSLEILKKVRNDYEVYLSAKQRLFKKWDDEDIIDLLQSCSYKLNEAYHHLSKIEVSDQRLKKSINNNVLLATHLQKDIEQEEEFVYKFLNTWKPLRIFAFL